jgi:hypothetical protein
MASRRKPLLQQALGLFMTAWRLAGSVKGGRTTEETVGAAANLTVYG